MQTVLERSLSNRGEPAGPARRLFSFASLAPGRLVSTLVLGLAAASCVPETRYEEARSAAEVEMGGRLRAEHRLREVEQERDRLQAELARRDGALAERDQVIDQSKLEMSLAAKERDEAARLVEQLRGELARVGDHMRVFSDQKSELEQALRKVEAARQAELEKGGQSDVVRARMMRDLTLLLHEPIASGRYGLDVQNGDLMLHVAEGRDDAALPKAVARIAQLYPAVKVELKERDPASGEQTPSPSAALEALGKALVDQGLARERLLLPAPKPEGAPAGGEPGSLPEAKPAEPAAAPAAAELEIRFLAG